MKIIIISIVIALGLILGVLFLGSKSAGNVFVKDDIEETQNINNVSIVEGKQIIEIRAKGGFNPKYSIAKAGVLTILRIDTNGTFDCSSVINIPSLKINQILPQTGITDIDLGIQKTGTLNGTCGMGMYPFEIEFQ